MKNFRFLKPVCFLLILVMIPLFSACGTNSEGDSELTMYVGLGNTNSDYFQTIHEVILENTGIDVKYVFNNTLDTTTAIKNQIANYDLPADIVITASTTPEESQKAAFLDLAAYTNIPDLFTVAKQQEIDIDGAIYQLPFSSRLIGITYNKTLLEEMGWELPNTYQEMAELKAKAEEAGIPFAVSGGVATGHGFNYLFYLMGSQYLTSPDGSEWFREFINGEAAVDDFAEASAYFETYAEAGLFGEVYDTDWNADKKYTRTRAIFYYNILNNVYTYDGFQYGEDGKIIGAEYNEDGTPVAEQADDGEAVYYQDEYVYYDADNEEMQDLERYHIPGAKVLHDEFGSMPWFSEAGKANYYTVYDNMHIALDKKLGEKGQEKKLEQAVKVLEFLTTEEATSVFTEMFPDGYVATNDFTIDESRIYYQYKDYVEKGYLMPWYYNSFDNDTIVNTGQEVNDYLSGKSGTSLNSIMTALETNCKAFLNHSETSLAEITETLSYEETAELEAIAGGMATQKALADSGSDITVDAAVIPYINDIKELPIGISLGVVQEKIYAGNLLASGIQAYVNDHANHPVVITMTGAELQELIDNGFSIKADYDIDTTFPYAYVLKTDESIEKDKTYHVAVSPESMEQSLYEQFLKDGKVIMQTVEGEEEEEEETPLTATVVDGIALFAETTAEISPQTILWQ